VTLPTEIFPAGAPAWYRQTHWPKDRPPIAVVVIGEVPPPPGRGIRRGRYYKIRVEPEDHGALGSSPTRHPIRVVHVWSLAPRT
jgi:hypothetical protein